LTPGDPVEISLFSFFSCTCSCKLRTGTCTRTYTGNLLCEYIQFAGFFQEAEMVILRIDDHLSLAMVDATDARIKFKADCKLISASYSSCPLDSNLCPSSLGQLYWFAKFVEDTVSQTNSRIVFCVGQDPYRITACSCMLGGYLIMMKGLSATDVSQIFQPLATRFQAFRSPDSTVLSDNVTVEHCWRALERAKANAWVDFIVDETDLDQCIDVHEYLHYDNPANGLLHVIIPSQLIAFQTPTDLSAVSTAPSNGKWADVSGKRHFAAAYYAEILSGDFDVGLVVRFDACVPGAPDHTDGDLIHAHGTKPACGSSAAGCDGAFEACGVAVERLGARPRGAALRDVDRFLTLARLAPGAVAVHGAVGTGLGAGGELLVTALLVARHGFDAAAALAWLRIAHPPAPPRVLSFAVLPPSDDAVDAPALPPGGRGRSATPPRRATLDRSRSAPALVPTRAACWGGGEDRRGSPPPFWRGAGGWAAAAAAAVAAVAAASSAVVAGIIGPC
jgi:hypothetical protein